MCSVEGRILLRQAPFQIFSALEIVERAALVADNSGTGLRTLKNPFGRWLALRIARHAKRLRMSFPKQQEAQARSDLASLGEVSRLPSDLATFDLTMATGLLSQNFYQQLMNGQDLAGRSLVQVARMKGNSNA